MIWGNRSWFAAMTPLNLVLMWVLLCWNQPVRSVTYIGFMALAFAVGMITEMIGVNTGLLFGDYAYGGILGPSLWGVPFVIGLNWFVVVFISTSVAEQFPLRSYTFKWLRPGLLYNKVYWLPVLGAAIATGFDWVMEPAAVALGFWTWHGDGHIPWLNYVCWFLISYLLILAGCLLRVDWRNRFSTPLLWIQALFFLLFRWLA